MEYEYFLKCNYFGDWVKVDKAVFIKAERDSGFYPKNPCQDVCATGGFSSGGISGRVSLKQNDKD